MFAVLIYRQDRTGPLVDRCVGGFNSQEESLQWAERHLFVPGQDFCVFEVVSADRFAAEQAQRGGVAGFARHAVAVPIPTRDSKS